MICYLVRHGKDDDSVRGGWSSSPLTKEGLAQAEHLADVISSDGNMNIAAIYSSDLVRAIQTAEILAQKLDVPIIALPEFRETNNGVLAGMDNLQASKQFPGLYWNTLEWQQSYPGGESPCTFFNRISDAWTAFKKRIKQSNRSVILVTHSGVINAIRCIESGTEYSNKANPFPIENAGMVGIEISSATQL